MSTLGSEHQKIMLDQTKIAWHQERLALWQRGERFAPITIDMALTRACQYSCNYCYALSQENERKTLTKDIIFNFLEDAALVGVKGISFVSDGESTMHPNFVEAVVKGHELGLSMASGTNGYALDEEKLTKVMPALTYIRINITAGEPARYAEIMGVKESHFHKVCENIRSMVRLKRQLGLKTTIGLQMVSEIRYADQILPLARLGRDLGVDYLVVKHMSDTEDGTLGVNYGAYKSMYDLFHAAEALSDENYQVTVKWNKIEMQGRRSYERCYGAPFLLQMSGSGLLSPCGMTFNERYKKLHIGNIATERFKDMVFSDRYWSVMGYLASEDFNAKKMCGSLCLQDLPNRYLDGLKKGEISPGAPQGPLPEHLNFI